MGFDENGNDINNSFDLKEPIQVGQIVWIKETSRLEFLGLVHSIPQKNLAKVRYLYIERFDEMRDIPFNKLRIFVANSNDSPTPDYCTNSRRISSWKSEWNMGRAIQRVVPMDRNRFMTWVLKGILNFDSITRMEYEFKKLMKIHQCRLLRNNQIENEMIDLLQSIYQSRLLLKSSVRTNEHENDDFIDQEDDEENGEEADEAEPEVETDNVEDVNQTINFTQIEIDADRICSKCQRMENVTKCCSHCFKHFDEACFDGADGEICSDCNERGTDDNIAHRKCSSCDEIFSEDKAHRLIRCIKDGCTVAYHRTRHCISAGAHLLTKTQMLCPMHSQSDHQQHSMRICAVCCGKGTSLIKCKTCPISFHSRKCLNMSSTRNKEIQCSVCEQGRELQRRTIVYAQPANSTKWWPAKIVSENEVTENDRRWRRRTKNGDNRSGFFWVHFIETNEYKLCYKSEVITFNQVNNDLWDAMRGKRINHRLDRAIAIAVQYQNETRDL